MRGPKAAKRHVGKHRPFPEWLYQIAWPNEVLNLKKKVPLQRRREIAQRLIAYLLFPPPLLAGPGGVRDKEASKSPKSQKKTNLKRARRENYEQLKTYMAFELARQLSVYEKQGMHRFTPEPDYDVLLHEFRILGGFGRLLSRDGSSLSSREIGKASWKEMVSAFLVFDLIAQHARRNVAVSETLARLTVLLCQDQYQLKLNHATLSQACQKYRSVAHLLVGILNVSLSSTEVAGSLSSLVQLRPTTAKLRKITMLGLDGVLAYASEIEKVWMAVKARKNSRSVDGRRRLVQLPCELSIPSSALPHRVLDIEYQVLEALESTNEDRLDRLEPSQITSASARTKRQALLASVRRNT